MIGELNEIGIFVERLKRIGIELELIGNVPWIYLSKVNGNTVKKEDWTANYGYTVAWTGARYGDEPYLDKDLKRTFEMIRKYK